MWLAASYLYLLLLITGASSRPGDDFSTGLHSNSHPSSLILPGIPFPNEEVTQTNAPFYLQRLISRQRIWVAKQQIINLTYTYKWNPSASGQNVVVYVIDTGIDINNPEFEGRAINGWSFDGNFDDTFGHGTLCASMVGGQQFGVAKKVRLEAVVVAHGQRGEMEHLIGGLDYVLGKCKDNHKQHACIASISMTLIPYKNGNVDQDLDNKVEEVSAGNAGTDNRHSPAGNPGAITVGALDHYDVPTDFSNYGKQVDIWALGGSIVALFIGDMLEMLKQQSQEFGPWQHHLFAHGSSYAAPQVAGIIALLISRHKNMPPQDIKDKVIQMGIRNHIQGLYQEPYEPRRIRKLSVVIIYLSFTLGLL
ncbi:hypothetical protein H0H93_016864 [Arthromyces matolae]|nr:hypothetical protein H0H93_016864 [Arthromyces matolae]